MAASPGLQDSNPWVDLAPEIREAESVLLSVRDQLRDELAREEAQDKSIREFALSFKTAAGDAAKKNSKKTGRDR